MNQPENPPQHFQAALNAGDISQLSCFPKADLHCHSIFGASLQSIQEWAGMPIKNPPSRMRDFEEMRDYSHKELYPVIYNRKGFEFTAERSIIESIQDGVTILEMSLDVNFIQFYDDREKGFFDFIHGLTAKYGEMIGFRPELGLSKNRTPSTQIPLALECIDSGLFRSIDLYGNEHSQLPEVYGTLYKHATSQGLKRKAHVGEFGDAVLIEQTMRALDLNEIQHGVAAAASKGLMRLLRKENVRLNVCPSSNVALSVSADLAHHPIRTLIDNGIRVSLNSDDKTIFGRSVSGEYLALQRAGVATADELDEIRKDSLRE